MPDPRFAEKLHEARNRAHEEARAVAERAAGASRVMTGEEQQKYDRANADIVRIDAELAEWRATALSIARANEARAGVESIVRPAIDNPRSAGEDPIRRWFADGIASRANSVLEVGFTGHTLRAPGAMPAVETRALSEGTGSGSLVLPTITASMLYSVLADTGAVWRLSPQIMSTPNGQPTNWPKITAYGTAAVTLEAGTLAQSDPSLGVTKTSPIKYSNLTLISTELVEDSAVDIGELVLDNMGNAMALGYGPAFATGAGAAGTITGYMTGGSVVSTGAGTITPMGVMTLQSKINQRYRASNAMFATTDGVLAYLRQYRSSGTLGADGPWLVNPPSAPGLPETIFGAPVVVDNFINASGSGVKEIAYGAFGKGYIIHEAGIRVESSFDYAFNTDQIAYRQIMRLDGEVQDSKAYGIYQRSS